MAQLDTADLQCNVALRQADLGVAEAALAALEAGSRPQEIEAAKAAWEKAAHALADLEAGSRPQEIAAAEAAVAAAAADDEPACRPTIAAPRRCSSGRPSRPKNTTPRRPPTMSPSKSIARRSSN